MENKKEKVLMVIGILTLLVMVTGATYAYFNAQGGEGKQTNVNVTTKTTDSLVFEVGEPLSITADQETFAEGKGNRSDSTIARSILTANNATADKTTKDEVTKTYNMYLDISANDFEYTKQDEAGKDVAELILKIMVSPTGNDADMQEVTTIAGLTRATVGDVTGFDVTKVKGLIKIAEDYEIKALSGDTTTQKWQVTLTFVNLDSDQNANAGKTFNATLKIQQEKEVVYPLYWNDGFSSTNYAIVDNKPTTPATTYGSVEELKSVYGETNFDSKPFYIKTTDTEHQACLYNKETGKEFCLGPNYWVSGDADGSQTKAKLQKAMAEALGMSESDLSCNSFSSSASCSVSSFYCSADKIGTVSCGEDAGNCNVLWDGSAICS